MKFLGGPTEFKPGQLAVQAGTKDNGGSANPAYGSKRMEESAYYHSPIGTIRIVGTEQGISRVSFEKERKLPTEPPSPCLKECVKQLDQYFKGQRQEFSLRLDLQGSDFQKRVWRALLAIPFGQTASYGDIAEMVGNGKAGRAVGTANRANPIAIIVPCHRVIGFDGSLVGYGAGLWRKTWLLKHEQKHALQKMGRRI